MVKIILVILVVFPDSDVYLMRVLRDEEAPGILAKL